MTLTVVNLTGVDVELKIGYIVVTAPPTPTPTGPTPTPTVAPTPACAYPPNVIGQTPEQRRDHALRTRASTTTSSTAT